MSDRRCRVMPVAPLLGRLVPMIAVFAGASGAVQAGVPLQFRLNVGDRLVYERLAQTTAGDGAAVARRTERIEIWVLEQSGPEWLLLVEVAPTVDGRPEPALGAVFRMDSAGRRRVPDEMLPRLDPLLAALEVLPALPLLDQNADAWVGGADSCGRRDRCVAGSTAAGGVRQIEFTSEDPPPLVELLEISRRGSFWFDPVAGVLTSLESEERDGRTGRRTRATAGLRQRLERPAAWAARRALEVEQYLRASRHEDRLLHELVMRPRAAVQTLEQLDRLWATLQGDVEARAESPIVALAEGRRQRLLLDRERLLARAALAERWLAQPARTWTLQDASGATQTSESARQGIVVEGFWSAAVRCNWRTLETLRNWPQVPGGSPVAVICYVTDGDWCFSRQVAAAAGLPCVLAGPLADAEGLPDIPMLRVLDATGTVRALWVGWQPAYPDAVELVRQLARSE